MHTISLNELVEQVPSLALVSGDGAVSITGLAIRSGEVTPGDLFCCIRGQSSDGHAFAADAVAAGAVAVLMARDGVVDGVPDDVPRLVTGDVRPVIGPIADLVNGRPSRDVPVFGVTGTNGKTTTTHILSAVVEAAGRTPGLIGTVGVRVGTELRPTAFTTPEAHDFHRILAEMRDAGNEVCIAEISSHALDQDRVGNVRFAAVGFTNLTRDHLDYHRGFEPYYLAKRRLFMIDGPEGQMWPAAINCDDEWGSRLFDELVHGERVDVPVWGYTLDGMTRASVSAEFRLTEAGAEIDVETPVGDFTVESPLHGRFNVENVLCATTMALLAGIEPEAIQRGVASMAGVPGRFQAIDAGQPFSVFVDYAHTPDSLEKVLSSARDLATGRVHVVFGRGGDRDRSKRPMMGRAASRGADHVVVTSDNPRSEDPESIIKEILTGTRGGTASIDIEVDRQSAIEMALSEASPGDVVIVAGKGHEQGQTFADHVVAFDDVEVVRTALTAQLAR